MPKVSVIMPAYNAEAYIKEAMDSILGQSFTNLELIVINDCSADETEAVVSGYSDSRIIYLKNERNMGVAATLNRGLVAAGGEYIARMDSDDISMPGRLALQVRFLDQNPDYAICGSSLTVFGENQPDRPFPYPETDKEIRANMMFNSPFAHPSVMIRAEMLKQCGKYYDENYEKAEDFELWYRLLRCGKGYNFQQPLLRYRHHGKQVRTANAAEQKEAVLRLRNRMVQELGAELTDEEMGVFQALCGGQRNFSQDEYGLFISGGKKLISAHPQERYLRQIYGQLNMAVKKASGCKGPWLHWKEMIYGIYALVKG